MKKILSLLLMLWLFCSQSFAASFNGGSFTKNGFYSNTDCSSTTSEGKECWDTDNDILYVGNGATATAVGPGGGGGTPGGSNTQVQFNDSSSFGGDAGLVYNKTTDTLTVGDKLITNTVYGATGYGALELYGGTGVGADIYFYTTSNGLKGDYYFPDLYTASGQGMMYVSGSGLISVYTLATNKLLGRSTAGTGDVEAITIGSGLSLAAGTLSSTGSGAPTTATYITQTSDAGLSAEQALASLSTGIMRVATTTGVVTSLTDSSGIASNISDETGSGALVFGTSPSFTTPILGTPTSGTLTNCTGLPVAGITASTSTALGVGSIELGHATDTTIARVSAGVASIEGVNIVTTSGTQTITNKWIQKRTGTTTSSATPTINTDNVSYYSLTAQTVDITSFTTNLSGTPVENQTLWISITGTAARAITWGSSFESSGTVTLPTTTVSTTRLDVGFVWNTATSKWRCVATA